MHVEAVSTAEADDVGEGSRPMLWYRPPLRRQTARRHLMPGERSEGASARAIARING
jgi:hypothetical protein